MQSDNSRQPREDNKQGHILLCLVYELFMKDLKVEIMRKAKGIKGNSQYDSRKYEERRRANLETGKKFISMNYKN